MNDVVKVTDDKAKKFDWKKVEMGLERQGTKIILPASPVPMTLEAAMGAIERMIESENMEFAISENVPCHFYDGVVAFAKAMKEIYGFPQAIPTPGFWGPTPPAFISVKTGPNVEDVVQVPFGSFRLPNVSGTIQVGYGLMRGIPVLQIRGKVKKKEKEIVLDLVRKTVEISKADSIYRGRSIVLDRDESGGLDFDDQLKFFDPHVGHEVPIFDEDTDLLIETAIITPIANADQCRKMNIPLKRGVLLEGPYGTGKTLVAKQVAKHANKANWTFISCTEVSALKYALKFAKMYQPAVIFAEDMDRIASSRSDEANTLINDIDGVVGKNDEIMIVFTTNFAKNIDKAFLRPGRLDAVISLRPPEKDAVERLVRFYAGGFLNKDVKLDKCMPLLAGNIPAAIRETVERAKLAAIMTKNKEITDDDLYVSALSMKNQLALAADAEEGKEPVDPVSKSLGKVVEGEARKLFKEFIGD